jgi:hypothetical protein
VFCPNCGTENDAQATSCKKCGFNLKGAAAPKFKGTMLMVNAPPSVPRIAATPGPGAVAPIGPAVPAPRPRLKGTMLGVAPPSPGGIAPPPPLEAAQPQVPPPPHGPGPAQPAALGPRSPSVNPLGGTMIASDADAPQAFQPVAGRPAAQAGFAATPDAGALANAHEPGFAPQAVAPAGAFPGLGAPPGSVDVQPPAAPPAYGALPAQPQVPAALPWAAQQGYPGQGAPYAPQQAPPQGYGAPTGYGAPADAQPQYQPQQGPPGWGGPAGAPGALPYAQPQYGVPPDAAGPRHGAPAQEGQGAYGQWGQQMPQGAGMMPYPGGPPMAAPGMHGPAGTVRNPIVVLVLCYVTCGIYALFWIWSSISELKAFRQKDDLNPIMFFIPILSIIETWNLPPKVLEAKQLAGVPNAQTFHPIFYLFLSPYFLTADLNEAFEAALARQHGG